MRTLKSELALRILCTALAGFAVSIAPAAHVAAQAPVNMRTHYDIYMTSLRIGEITWTAHFAEQSYQASANGKASGVVSVLLNGEGSVATHGDISAGKIQPTKVKTIVIDDDGRVEVRMTYDNGDLKRVDDRGPPPKAGRIAVTPALLRNVTDPLSGMLIPAGSDAFAHANCSRTLRIFDGRRRYNLVLSYNRIDAMKVARGYAGRVLVCGVVLRPLAGYDPDSLLVRYLAGKSDLELWFAPVAGAAVLVPVRAVMPTLIGTLELRATEFEPAVPAAAQGSGPH
jgi:hypothetical protein